jgi:hypothetical protein
MPRPGRSSQERRYEYLNTSHPETKINMLHLLVGRYTRQIYMRLTDTADQHTEWKIKYYRCFLAVRRALPAGGAGP